MEDGIERLEDGGAHYEQQFFRKPAYLTVSGQMQVEYSACALSNVYSFGPTFRSASPAQLVTLRADQLSFSDVLCNCHQS